MTRFDAIRRRNVVLLLQQAGVACNALPAALGEGPSICEAAPMFVGLTLIGAFGVIDADHHRGIGIHADLEVLNGPGW